jgi:hypothetical protein
LRWLVEWPRSWGGNPEASIGMPGILLLVVTTSALALAVERAILAVDPLAGAPAEVRQAAHLLLVFPVVEEVSRATCARALGAWSRSAPEAAAIGLGLGTVEFLIKAWGQGPLTWMLALSAFPLQVALSLAFYSFARARVVKTLALHVVINATGAISGFVLHAILEVGPLAHAAGVLTAVSIVSVVIGVRVQRGTGP